MYSPARWPGRSIRSREWTLLYHVRRDPTAHTSRLLFMSQPGIDGGAVKPYGLERLGLPVKRCREMGKKDLKLNDHEGKIEIDAETFRVKLDGEMLPVDAANGFPLTSRYILS